MDTYAAQMTERYAQEETGGRVEALWAGEYREKPHEADKRRRTGWDFVEKSFAARKGLLERAGWWFVEMNVALEPRRVVFKVRWIGSIGSESGGK